MTASIAVAAIIAVAIGMALGAALVLLLKGAKAAALMASLNAEHQHALAALQQQLQQHSLNDARQQERLTVAAEQEKSAQLRHEKTDAERRDLEKALRERDARFAEIETRLQAEREQVAAQTAFVKEQEVLLKLQFEQLATKIFEEKSQKFSEQNKTGLDGLLSPLREQLKEFKEKVETNYSNEARERFSLKEQIIRLEDLNKKISDDASNLTRALKGDKKMQGNWGEVILSRVLEESGLREGHEYVTQMNLVSEEGQRRLPDVIVRLPEGRDIVIDSKVSLNDYERYCASEDAAEREKLLKLHTGAVRNHIKALSEKRYEDLAGLRTLDFVFLFMPIESAFMLAVEHDAALFQEAFDKKIIIVSPTTLLATLRTVESIWRYERQNQNAEKIAKEAGLLHDKFATLLEHLKKLGDALERSQESYRKTVSSLSGHGGLVGRVESLKKLGAKAKKSLALERLDIASENTDDTTDASDTGGNSTANDDATDG